MLNTKIIGNKIAEARKKVNISQSQLAQSLFISPQAVGKWERGESMPDIITLNRLAELLGVDLNYFSDSFPSAAAENVPADPIVRNQAELSPGKEEKLAWDMSRGNWLDADFSGLKNLNEKFSSSNMQRCLFTGSDLSGLLLSGNNVDRCDFSGSNISNSHIKRSHLANNVFRDCSLNAAEFSGSYVYACDFTAADFTGMTLKSGGFEKNTLTNTVLNRTSFIESHLVDLVFEGTVENCYFENCSFKRVTFRNAKLVNTFFKNKSLKQIRFVDCQADRMTYEFLKNGKADLSGLSLITE
ncbi:MAG: transcriptional regulator [Crocinitomicaceae bacterium]|jgi:uncharacterized protein YjbI with pentapeptide repeats|nr:transcriptional regulator [Crocinitomicaceae bacterium]